ncbi:MAG: hypothetical protein CVU57_05945 [Deltaproteobacteria bacterium HGW-Deltaproteobacteria-15]|nr:MAG: hypothetical protein CVU57_05945 [Deltaproteobacteria bacterium HGW-Deltaproteobacteria-15]
MNGQIAGKPLGQPQERHGIFLVQENDIVSCYSRIFREPVDDLEIQGDTAGKLEGIALFQWSDALTDDRFSLQRQPADSCARWEAFKPLACADHRYSSIRPSGKAPDPRARTGDAVNGAGRNQSRVFGDGVPAGYPDLSDYQRRRLCDHPAGSGGEGVRKEKGRAGKGHDEGKNQAEKQCLARPTQEIPHGPDMYGSNETNPSHGKILCLTDCRTRPSVSLPDGRPPRNIARNPAPGEPCLPATFDHSGPFASTPRTVYTMHLSSDDQSCRIRVRKRKKRRDSGIHPPVHAFRIPCLSSRRDQRGDR